MDLESIISSTPRTARSESFDFCLKEIHKRFGENPINIVGTGCIRQLSDSGDGWSDLIFANWTKTTGGTFFSVDISAKHLNIAREVLINYKLNEYVNLIEDDSINFLKNNFQKEKIHVLFLDSFDTDIKMFCAVHQVCEAKEALEKMDVKGMVLLDDVGEDENNPSLKAKFSIPFLKANGYEILYFGNGQCLLGR